MKNLCAKFPDPDGVNLQRGICGNRIRKYRMKLGLSVNHGAVAKYRTIFRSPGNLSITQLLWRRFPQRQRSRNNWTFAKSPFKPPNGDFVKSKTLEIRAKTIFAKWRLAVKSPLRKSSEIILHHMRFRDFRQYVPSAARSGNGIGRPGDRRGYLRLPRTRARVEIGHKAPLVDFLINPCIILKKRLLLDTYSLLPWET